MEAEDPSADRYHQLSSAAVCAGARGEKAPPNHYANVLLDSVSERRVFRVQSYRFGLFLLLRLLIVKFLSTVPTTRYSSDLRSMHDGNPE